MNRFLSPIGSFLGAFAMGVCAVSVMNRNDYSTNEMNSTPFFLAALGFLVLGIYQLLFPFPKRRWNFWLILIVLSILVNLCYASFLLLVNW